MAYLSSEPSGTRRTFVSVSAAESSGVRRWGRFCFLHAVSEGSLTSTVASSLGAAGSDALTAAV